MTVAWVLGSGGLLGSALCRRLCQLGTTLFFPHERLIWHSEAILSAQLAESVHAFVDTIGIAEPWEIYWVAGIGTMGCVEAELTPETRVLSQLLRLLEAEPTLKAKPGAFAFASTAGGIYAGSGDYLISENTPPSPTTAYAREKLRQEELLQTFAEDGKTVLLARISTLYGPGQSLGKKQGLVTHMARCALRNQAIQIYVPFDTIRDYINADDAAFEIVSSLRFTVRTQNCVIKIIASEQPTTIAQIISAFKVITRRSPRIVTSSNKLGSLYSRCVRFKSEVEPCRKGPPRTSLLVGIAQVMASEHEVLAQASRFDAHR